MRTSHEVVSRPLLAATLLVLSASGCESGQAARTDKASPVSGISREAKTTTSGNLVNWNYWDRHTVLDRIGAMATATGVCTCYKSDQFTCLTAAHCFLHCPDPDKTAQKDIGEVLPRPQITFRAASAHTLPPVPSDSYGVAIPKDFWKGCWNLLQSTSGPAAKTKAKRLMRLNDIAVIRFRGTYDAVGNDSDTVYLGKHTPTSRFEYYDVGPNAGEERIGTFLPAESIPELIVAGFPGISKSKQIMTYGKGCDVAVPTPPWEYPTLVASEGRGHYGTNETKTLQDGDEPELLYFTNTVVGGHSGAPVWRDRDKLVAISTGTNALPGCSPVTVNRGTALTRTVLDWISRVKGY